MYSNINIIEVVPRGEVISRGEVVPPGTDRSTMIYFTRVPSNFAY